MTERLRVEVVDPEQADGARGEDGGILGYTGVRLLPDLPATAEAKRMYVALPAVGQGLAAVVRQPAHPGQ